MHLQIFSDGFCPNKINGASVNVSWVRVFNLPAAAFSKSFNMAAFVFADKSVSFLTAMHNTWAILRRYEPGKKKLWIEDCNGRVRSVYLGSIVVANRSRSGATSKKMQPGIRTNVKPATHMQRKRRALLEIVVKAT